MTDAHAFLTLRAAHVAAAALKTISALRPWLGPPNGEVRGFREALLGLRAIYQTPKLEEKRTGRTGASVHDIRSRVSRSKKEVEELEEPNTDSDWDPEPIYEASRCQAFLMEIIRRAASDWVQYRQSRKMELKALADQAYTWLFEEEPGHPAWKDRDKALFKIEDEETGQVTVEVGTRRLTSFLAICEACNLDPEAVRQRAREMTVEQVTKTGRRIERRNTKASNESMSIEAHSVVVDIDLDALDTEEHGSYDHYGSRDSHYDHAW